jgi:hypothetical protein
VLRSHNDHELLPDAISVIGRPESGEGLVLEYFDSRGVRRTYAVSLEDGVLRWWRDQAGFEQRSYAELGPTPSSSSTSSPRPRANGSTT